MKFNLLAACMLLSFSVSASSIRMDHFNWTLTDINEKGLTKEDIFKSLDRSFIKLSQSICANRALMWLHQIKKEHGVDGSKIFVFYTPKTGKDNKKNWWYHVAPIINEAGNVFVVDAGFPSFITGPLTTQDWLTKFTVTGKCLEIKPQDQDLISLINGGVMFPEETAHGKNDCYYVKAPAGTWFPSNVAAELLGEEKTTGEINSEEVYPACLEAVTNPVGRVFGNGKKKCRKFATSK